jgi:sugar lactone lactonase YvrE
MFHRVHLARPQLVLFLGILSAVGCARQQVPSGDEAAAPETESSAGIRPSEPIVESSRQSELLLELPPGCNTPDAMALLADGSILLSVPNFNDLEEGALLMRITPDNQAEKFLDLPNHPNTGQPIGPLGVCLAPSGDLFLADYQMTGARQSRVLRIAINDGKPGKIEPVVTGFHVSNAVICRDGYLYVSETQIDPEAQPATSGVFRFSLEELDQGPLALADNETEDPHFLATIHVHNKELPLGADGLCFDAEGNLYIGNFADGTVHRFEFDTEGNVKSNTVFAQADFMKSADGLFMDQQSGVIYVADSKANAVQMVFADGSVKTLAQNGDTDGLDGGMDQPCEVLLRGDKVIVSNMDWPVPGCINQTYNPPCTLSVIRKN